LFHPQPSLSKASFQVNFFNDFSNASSMVS
jgi:hypothetical protein